MKSFKTPAKSLGSLDAATAGTLVAAAADVSIIVDETGVIRDVAFQSDELERELHGYENWLGLALADTVTGDSRTKVERLLREASNDTPKSRHLNHVAPGGGTVPVLYSAVRFGAKGRVVAFGRDMRALSVLQQRLVDAQQSMEREYGRLRSAELRYRMLFQTAPEAVLVVDAGTNRVQDANPAARTLIGRAIAGNPFAPLFVQDDQRPVMAMLSGLRAGGPAVSDGLAATLTTGRRVRVSAAMFREDASLLFLVRIAGAASAEHPGPTEAGTRAALLDLVEHGPDGFVMSDVQGQILHANAAFIEMAQLATVEQARGESLDRWVGRPGVDLDVLLANLRQRGAVRMFNTIMHGEHGETSEVEISASALPGEPQRFGLAIRTVGARFSLSPRASTRAARELPKSVEHLSELIGRVALKDLVREATDVIERLCIEAALEMSNDNRASAAEMLGLSRQSLYVKLRRYGLGDLSQEGGE